MALPAAPAHASTAGVSGGVLTYTAAVGEINNVTVSRFTAGGIDSPCFSFDGSGGCWRLTDTGATVTPGASCLRFDANTVHCPVGAAGSASFDLGDQNDTLLVDAALPSTIEAGLGRDTVTGGPADDRLKGGPGQRSGQEHRGEDDDTFNGGGGTDTADYSGRQGRVAIRLVALPAGVQCNVSSPLDCDNVGRSGDVENAIGGAADDLLVGTAGANAFDGGPGADTLAGLFGPDLIRGGDGTDTVTYGKLLEPWPVDYGEPRAVAVGVDPDGIADDGNADDGPAGARDNVLADVENLIGGSGNDTLTGDGDDNVLDGGLGADVFVGGGGTDTVTYAGYRPSFSPAVTADIGGGANDGNADDGPAGARDDIPADVENITGGGGDDSLTGDGNANSLSGGGGDDLLTGRGGPDVLDGGDDTSGMGNQDTVSYADRSSGVTARLTSLGADNGNGEDGPDGARDTISRVEHLTGGGGADDLTGNGYGNVLDGGAGPDMLDGRGGGDRLRGGGGVDTADYSDRPAPVEVTIDGLQNDAGADNVETDVENVIGTQGGDSLTGDGDANVLAGNGGNDSLNGLAGADVLEGGGGNDSLTGLTGPDLLQGGEGDDTARYAERTGSLSLSIGDGPDDGNADDGPAGARDDVGGDVEHLVAGSGDDRLVGDRDPNRFSGGGGSDTVDYSARAEPVKVTLDGRANDGAFEGDAVESDVENVFGGAAGDTLEGDGGANVLRGNGGGDRLVGNPGADVLEAGDGDDDVEGGTGDDTLTGGEGVDLLFGGFGNDRLLSRDGSADENTCGPDADAVVADHRDAATADCEAVDRPSAAPANAFSIARVTLSRATGTAVVTVAVPAPGRVTLLATARVPRGAGARSAKTIRVARLSRRVASAGPVRLVLRPSTAAKRVLRRASRLKTSVRVTYAPTGGTPATRTRSITLRLRR